MGVCDQTQQHLRLNAISLLSWASLKKLQNPTLCHLKRRRKPKKANRLRRFNQSNLFLLGSQLAWLQALKSPKSRQSLSRHLSKGLTHMFGNSKQGCNQTIGQLTTVPHITSWCRIASVVILALAGMKIKTVVLAVLRVARRNGKCLWHHELSGSTQLNGKITLRR